MRKFFGIALAMVVTASASAATFEIPITRSGFFAIHNNVANNEIVRKSNNGGNGNQFNWGGFNAATANAVAFGANVLQMNTAAAKDGSYLYTRFDTSAITESATEAVAHNVPSVVHDASAPGTIITLNFDYSSVVDCELAVLIRDKDRWYESSAKALPVLTGAQSLVFELDGANATTWTALDMTNAAVMDMDQVMSGTTGPLAYAGAMAPDFTTIQGVGIVCKAPATNSTGNFGLSKITFAEVVASADHWMHY